MEKLSFTANMAGVNQSTKRLNLLVQSNSNFAWMMTEYHTSVLNAILTLLLLIGAATYIHYDYKTFLSLGPGGTPSTPAGYLKIKLLSIICLRDPIRPTPIPPHFRPQKGYLDADALPKRRGERPRVEGVAPQRQQTQRSEASIYAQLVGRIHITAVDPRNRLIERTSCFEKHSSGLFTSDPITRTCGGEICHAHASDGSMHMTLHPADANLMLENGWGERHPLARGGWCRRFVPKEFVLVYAPRDEAEVDIVMRIVAASIWWVSGIDVHKDEEDPRRRTPDAEVLGRTVERNKCWSCKLHGCGGGQVAKMTGNA